MSYKFRALTLRLEDTLTLTGDEALKLVPVDTHRRQRIVWEGPPDRPAVRLLECSEPYMADVDFYFNQKCANAVELRRDGTGARPSTMFTCERVRFFGDGRLEDPVRWASSDDDENNEHGTFRNVKAFGITGYFAHVTQTAKQSKEHVFDQCCVEGGRGAVRAPSAFTWRGGTVSGTSEAAFQLYGGGGDRVKVQDVGVEKCARLLDIGSENARTSDPWKVTLDNVRFAADRLAADGHMVRMYNAGPLTVRDCQLGGGDMPAVPTVLIDAYGQPLVRLSANWFDAWGAYRTCPLVTAPGREVIVDWGLNTYSNDAGDPTRARVLGLWNPPKEV